MFYLVDAFTDTPYKGNPAGVYIVKEFWRNEEMQRLASYYNWSEIAFVKPLRENEFYIRWFSPKDEAPLCGHATVAATHIIFTEGYTSSKQITLHYNDGKLRAERNELGGLSVEMPLKPVIPCPLPGIPLETLIGVRSSRGAARDHLVLIIELDTPHDIIRARPNFDAIKNLDCRALAITAIDSEGTIHSRYFAPKIGINEDPVCGSLHCRLAHYWSGKNGVDTLYAHQASRREGYLQLKILKETVLQLTSAVKTANLTERV